MLKMLIVGAGGFLGAVARYLLAGAVQRAHGGTFPLGTMAVNVLGCLAIGACIPLLEDRQVITPGARLFLMIGFLGAFTTFSAFGYETVELLRDGQWAAAALNAGGNLFACLSAVALGRMAVKLAGV